MGFPSSCSLRVDRAEKQLNALKTKMSDFIKGNTHTVGTGIDPNTGEKLIGVFFPHPPDDFTLEVSEFLHHLRSALDSLIFNLAGCPDDRYSALLFPIFPKKVDYLKHEQAYLKGVGVEAKAVVQSLQPYHVPKDWHGGSPYEAEKHPLMFLHDFNRVDKHRMLRILQPSVEHLSVAAPETISVDQVRLGVQEGETGVLRVPANMDVQVRPTFSVAFEDTWPTRGAEVAICLSALLTEVRDRVLPRFARFFYESGILIPESNGPVQDPPLS
jgi:hypothetical protein